MPSSFSKYYAFFRQIFLVAHKNLLFEEKIEAVDWGVKIDPIYHTN